MYRFVIAGDRKSAAISYREMIEIGDIEIVPNFKMSRIKPGFF